MSDSATPWTSAHQAPPSTGFSRQEYWSGVPLPSPNNDISCGKKIKHTGRLNYVFICIKNVRWPFQSKQVTQIRSFYGCIVYMWRVFFIHSSVDGHFGCFRVLAIVNTAAISIVFWNDGCCIFSFLKALHIVLHSGYIMSYRVK